MYWKTVVKYLLCDLKPVASYPPAMQYEDEKIIWNTKEEYQLELEPLKEAHPLTPPEDIDGGHHTHTLMTGGKFLMNDEEPIPPRVVFPKAFAELHCSARESLPRLLGRPETCDDMLWLMIRHTVVNRKAWDHDACLTEVVRKPHHRFFLDLDLLFAQEHESEQAWNLFVRKICLSVGKAVLSCYPEIALSEALSGTFEFAFMATKGYRPKTVSEDTTVYKSGIHMVWPGLVVDNHRAEYLARAVDEFLTRDVPRDLQRGENSWKKAIDLIVYKSGLRGQVRQGHGPGHLQGIGGDGVEIRVYTRTWSAATRAGSPGTTRPLAESERPPHTWLWPWRYYWTLTRPRRCPRKRCA